MKVLTTLEASNLYKMSTRYLRVLLAKGLIKGRQAKISTKNSIWLIEEASLQRFLKKERKVGRPKKKL